MSVQTGIEWCDRTASPWYGCQHVSPACNHCYAESWAKRSGMVGWGPHADRRKSVSYRKQMLKWNREAENAGVTYKVFASLCDPLDNAVPIEWFVDYLDVLRTTTILTHLLLTKRIGNLMSRLRAAAEHARACSVGLDDPLAKWINDWHNGNAPGNVWLGATVINQEEADRDIPKLLTVPARIRFLSIEPMLGPIDLTSVEWPNKGGHRVDVLRGGYWNKAGCIALGPSADLGEPRGGFTNHSDMPGRLSWVIAGGESGPKARPMHPEWVRSLRDQCVTAGVPFLFKQWGEWAPNYLTEDGERIESTMWMDRMGKKAAGRLLDGRTHDEYPA